MQQRRVGPHGLRVAVASGTTSSQAAKEQTRSSANQGVRASQPPGDRERPPRTQGSIRDSQI